MLAEVMGLHEQTQQLLRTGKQRLRQTRELLRIDADLLAHACLLIGDLEKDRSATAYGEAAMLCAHEAESNKAIALSAQAKTARWKGQLAKSAELARRGFECSPAAPIRVLLAYQEANSAALLGDACRAREALKRAEEAARTVGSKDLGLSAWSCPVPRQALFALSVATQTGDPDAALEAAQMADANWAAGATWACGTWAQIRVGAGIAHVMKGSLDCAAEQIKPMLTLSPEYRMATVTRYLSQLDRRLGQRRFRNSRQAAQIREHILEFNSAALPATPVKENT